MGLYFVTYKLQWVFLTLNIFYSFINGISLAVGTKYAFYTENIFRCS
jgi:hypothetical protein